MNISNLLGDSVPVYKPTYTPAPPAPVFNFITYHPQNDFDAPMSPCVSPAPVFNYFDAPMSPCVPPAPVFNFITYHPENDFDVLMSPCVPLASQTNASMPSASDDLLISPDPFLTFLSPSTPLPALSASDNLLLPDTLLKSSSTPPPPLSIVSPLVTSFRLAALTLNPGFVDTGGATSFAERYPQKDVQPPRFCVRGSQSDAVKLGQAERKARRVENTEQLNEGVANIIELQDNAIKSLSEKLFVNKKVIWSLINGESHYLKTRGPNGFNALVHKATEEMNDGMFSPFSILTKTNVVCHRTQSW